jgi:DNA-binding XRE family transcriptional regulator
MPKQSQQSKTGEKQKKEHKSNSSSKRLEQRQAAQDLFIYSGRTQKEIAEIIGVSEQTIVRWKEEGKWEQLKGANNLTANQVISNLYKRALELSQDPSSNADRIAKIASAIDRLKPTRNTLTSYISAFMDLGNWLKNTGKLQEAKLLTKAQKEFIQEQVNKI